MKLAALSLVFAVCAASGIAQAPAPEPEFNDTFAALDAGKLMPLERQTAAIQGKTSGFIVVSGKAASEFPGDKSPVRFHAGQPLDFVVRSAFAASAVDPATFYVLRRLNAKKKSRELVISSVRVSPLGASTNTNLAQGVLPVAFAKYGGSSFKVTTASLPPGEYALSLSYGQTVFCFGVD